MNKIDRYKILVRYMVDGGLVESQKDLGRIMGYSSASAFSQIINNKVAQPKDFISKLKTIVPDLNEDWIENNDGEMLRSEKREEQNASNTGNSGGVNIASQGDVKDNHISMVAEHLKETIADKEEIIALLKEKNAILQDKTELQREIINKNNRDIKELTEQCARMLTELTEKPQ